MTGNTQRSARNAGDNGGLRTATARRAWPVKDVSGLLGARLRLRLYPPAQAARPQVGLCAALNGFGRWWLATRICKTTRALNARLF